MIKPTPGSDPVTFYLDQLIKTLRPDYNQHSCTWECGAWPIHREDPYYVCPYWTRVELIKYSLINYLRQKYKSEYVWKVQIAELKMAMKMQEQEFEEYKEGIVEWITDSGHVWY